MKKLFLFIVAAIIFAACKKTVKQATEIISPPVQPVATINAIIRQAIQQQGEFNWNTAPVELVWSALVQGDHILSVGYKPAGEINVEDRLHTIDINETSWKAAKEEVLQIIFEEERKTNPSLDKASLEIWPEEVLPVLDVTVKNYATLLRLRASVLVRYAEPLGYDTKLGEEFSLAESNSGCGSNTANLSLTANLHYIPITPNAKASWNYSAHGIQSAWTKSTGAGVKIFIIDTGCEFDQENLGTAFNQGYSSGRTIERIVTLPRSTVLSLPVGPLETPDDGCGHGTSMAGACAAPRGTDGNTAGVAYNCNLVTCRASSDVFIDASREAKGVADAFTNAGNRSDVKIISMSMGRITSSSQISDGVRYAYGKGKLIFTAAGTSFGWTASWVGVIFPATMNEVQAVTGVEQYTNFSRCDACHTGSEVDFVVVMEREVDEMFPLSLSMSGDDPSTVGGSSVATATMAGMSALLWSRYSWMTRDQVLVKLQENSNRYPVKSTSYGWGTLNVNTATN